MNSNNKCGVLLSCREIKRSTSWALQVHCVQITKVHRAHSIFQSHQFILKCLFMSSPNKDSNVSALQLPSQVLRQVSKLNPIIGNDAIGRDGTRRCAEKYNVSLLIALFSQTNSFGDLLAGCWKTAIDVGNGVRNNPPMEVRQVNQSLRLRRL